MSAPDPSAAATSRFLQYLDPVLDLGTRQVNMDKAFKGMSDRRWSYAAASMVQLRTALTWWITSAAKTDVSQEDLDRLSTVCAMLLSLATITHGQGVPPPPALKHYSIEWTSPLSVSQGPPGGLVGALVGVAVGVAGRAASSAVAAASSAASGAPASEVLRRAMVAGAGSSNAPAVDGDGVSPAALRTLWRADTVQQDAAMWSWAYAMSVRQAGLQRCLSAFAGANPVEASAAAVQLLRQAAGLLDYQARVVLPAVDAALSQDSGGRGKQPPELQRNVAVCLGLVCLAEAQAITTARAVDKGSSPSLVAGLEAGTAQLYLMARMALCGVAVPDVSPTMGSLDPRFTPPSSAGPVVNSVKRLHTYITTAHALHHSRSRLSQAVDWEGKGELGIAQACAKEGESAVQAGLKAARSAGQHADPSWVTALEAQAAAVTSTATRLERDRLNVSYQPLPKEVPDAPGVKVLVSKIPTAPPVYVPPEPSPELQAQQQNCTVQ